MECRQFHVFSETNVTQVVDRWTRDILRSAELDKYSVKSFSRIDTRDIFLLDELESINFLKVSSDSAQITS